MASVPFDSRDGVIWYDGKFVDWKDAKVHVLTHALHYGSAVFEGERAYSGEVYKLREHSQRLISSAEILGFKLPYSLEEIEAATNATLARSGLVDAYVRPIAWRGSENMGVAAPNNTIHMAIAVWEWPSYFSPAEKLKGIRLTWAPYRRPDPLTIPCKSKAAGLYMICTISKHAAEAQGYTDALMLDYRGYVAESTGANIVFVRDGELHTPDPDCFLDSITRQSVEAIAARHGIKVNRRHILPEELATFTEAFLVGTAAEVTPISEIGEYRFKPAAISELLMHAYLDEVQPKKVAAAE
ncbi:branched-chain amino acid aminotransferase [Pleomorphomonas sp. PLEO]|uniref:branched-chain amino acid aminotransferase n=1 Tax=Pleomorphomonas sp. PLEO TaxID=3239306 RepID=UPI00351ED048